MASSANFPGSKTPIRTTLLYGAAFGFLVGLVIVAATGPEESTAIGYWRNSILIGGGIGFLVGIGRAWIARSSDDSVPPPSSDSST